MTRPAGAPRSRRTLVAAAAVLALLSGCGLFSEKKTPPSPLPELQASLNVAAAWRLSIGSLRETFLQPALVENALYP